MKRLTLLAATLFCIHSATAQSNTTVDDLFTVKSDSTLTIMPPGLLENDEIASSDSFQIILVDDPINGTLALGSDGSFTYEPDAGFSGTDSFTYLLETRPFQTLVVDTSNSSVELDMEVSLGPIDSDSASSAVSGTVSVLTTPYDAPFEQIELVDMNLVVTDSINLDFDFSLLQISGSADTNAFAISLVEAGPAADVMSNAFTLTDNAVNLAGVIDASVTGIANIDTSIVFNADSIISIPGMITQNEDMMTVESSFVINDTLEVEVAEGVNAIIITEVSGKIRSEGPIKRPVQSNLATVTITVEPPVSTATEEELPLEFSLAQNYPNPFNPVTSIAFSIPTADRVTLKVFDTLGREVRTLVDGILTPGQHEVRFEAENLPSGMYIYRLETNESRATKQLMLVK